MIPSRLSKKTISCLFDRSFSRKKKLKIRRDQVPLQDVALPPLGLVRRSDVVPSRPRRRRDGVPGKEDVERERERDEREKKKKKEKKNMKMNRVPPTFFAPPRPRPSHSKIIITKNSPKPGPDLDRRDHVPPSPLPQPPRRRPGGLRVHRALVLRPDCPQRVRARERGPRPRPRARRRRAGRRRAFVRLSLRRRELRQRGRGHLRARDSVLALREDAQGETGRKSFFFFFAF